MRSKYLMLSFTKAISRPAIMDGSHGTYTVEWTVGCCSRSVNGFRIPREDLVSLYYHYNGGGPCYFIRHQHSYQSPGKILLQWDCIIKEKALPSIEKELVTTDSNLTYQLLRTNSIDVVNTDKSRVLSDSTKTQQPN